MMHDLPPPAVMMQMLLGRFVSQAIGAAAKLKIADHLAQGPRTSDELAKLTGAQGQAIHRVLRALAGVGVFAEQEPGRFANTPLSETLRDAPGSVRPMAMFFNSPAHVEAWIELDHAVQTGQSAFVKAHDKTPWEYVVEHPDMGEIFNHAMSSISAQFAPAVVAGYDFKGIDKLVDVGGGHGFLLTTILKASPGTRGVLFDLPHVVSGSGPLLGSSGVADRVEVVPGDFFAEVPRSSAYVMKHIIHDWSDDKAIAIMKTIHRCAEPAAKLLLVESVIKPGNTPDMAKLIDLEMLVITDGGRERTEAEFAAIFAAAGWKLQRVVPTPAPVSVLEATRV